MPKKPEDALDTWTVHVNPRAGEEAIPRLDPNPRDATARAILNYVIWEELARDGRPKLLQSIPPHQQPGAAAFAKVDPADLPAFRRFAREAWTLICEETSRGTDKAYEAEAKRNIRKALPCLDDWTFEVTWNVAYVRAMM